MVNLIVWKLTAVKVNIGADGGPAYTTLRGDALKQYCGEFTSPHFWAGQVGSAPLTFKLGRGMIYTSVYYAPWFLSGRCQMCIMGIKCQKWLYIATF